MNQAKLNLALFRGALKMKWRLVAAGMILGSALAMYAGIYSAIESLFGYRDMLYSSLNIADLEVRIVPEDNVNLPALEGIPGVAAVERRLQLPGNIDLASGGKLYAGFIALDPPGQINRLRIDQGQALDESRPTEVVIERSMANHHGFKVGDRFSLNIGKDRYDLTVRGIALSPEFLIDSANPNFFLPSKGSLGVVFAPYSLVEARLGYKLVNSVVVKADKGAAIDQVEKAVLSALGKKVTIDESTPLKRQFSHLFLEQDLGAFAIFIPAIVLIFVTSALVVTVFLMYQWLTEKRSEIGVLMALGYCKVQIALAFATPVLLIALIGLVSGTLLSFVLLYGFGLDYSAALGFPKPDLALRPALLLQGYAGVLAALAISAAIPLRQIVQLSPREAIKGASGENAPNVKRVCPRISAALSRSVVLRYAIRNLQRAKGVALMTVIAVALSLGASLAYFISLTSFEHAIVSKYADDRWDLSVDFLSPLWDDELDALRATAGVTRVDPYLRGAVKIRNGERTEPSFLLGIDPGSPSRRLRIVEGRLVSPDDRSAIVLEKKAADALGYKVGDTIVVEAREKAWNARLVGVFSGVLPGEAYASLAQAQEWFDMSGQVSGAFLDTGAGLTDPDQLYRLDRVGRVTEKARLIREIVHHLNEVTGIVILAFAFSLLVAVLFLFSTTAFGVLRRQGEYAMLRTIGFSDGTVARIVLLEVSLVGMVGVAIASCAGVGLSSFLNGVLSEAWFKIDTVVTMKDIAIVLVPGLLFLPLTAWPPIRNILRAGLVPMLRKRAFG